MYENIPKRVSTYWSDALVIVSFWTLQTKSVSSKNMILSITSLKLKNPLYILIVPYFSMRVIFQLRTNSNCVKFKTNGMGFTSYTMSLWKDEKDILEFYKHGAHAVAMRKATKYAQEIRIVRHHSDDLISWSEAKSHLKNAKVITS